MNNNYQNWENLRKDIDNVSSSYLPLSGGTIKGHFTLVPDDSGNYNYSHAIYAGLHGIDHTDFYENQFNFYANGASNPGTTPMLQIDSTNGTIVNSNLKSTSFRTANKEITEESGRICIGSYGQSTAEGLSAGSLLISNAWADAPKVPTNGIYSKGEIIAPAFKQVYTNPTTATSYTIDSNKEYFLNPVNGNLSITLGSPVANIVNEYKFSFRIPTSSTNTTITLPAYIKWISEPEFNKGYIYEINIKYNPIVQLYLGTFIRFVSSIKIEYSKLTGNLTNKFIILLGTYYGITNPVLYVDNGNVVESTCITSRDNSHMAYFDESSFTIKEGTLTSTVGSSYWRSTLQNLGYNVNSSSYTYYYQLSANSNIDGYVGN